MEELIAPCGNNCVACPLYIANTDEDLQKAAELWHKLGWADSVLPINKIKCKGCSINAFKPLCKFGIISCLKQRNLSKCNQCSDFPCDKINIMLAKNKQDQKELKKICTESEYRILCKAFYEKEENLKKQ